MKSISMKAYAKINLGLDVIGKLENGYHEVRMIMQSVDLYDKITVTRNDSGKIILLMLRHPEKHQSPKVLTPYSIVTLLNSKQSLKQYFPTDDAISGI